MSLPIFFLSTFYMATLSPHTCAAANWFSSGNNAVHPSSTSPDTKHSDFTTVSGEELIQCSPEMIKAYDSVPKVSGPGYGDLEWCRAIMKRAKTVM
jgi:hypothetical protein